MRILNTFLLSKNFDNLNNFFAKKIFKLFKIFFVETHLDDLPERNYPLKNIDDDLLKSKNFAINEVLPYISYSHLPHLLQIVYEKKNNLKICDYGAGNLNLYYYLNKKFKNLNYFFKDQKLVEEKVRIIANNNKLKNLFVSDPENQFDFDILYFGSTLQYIKNYKEELNKFFSKSKYILVSQTPFFQNDKLKEKIILKQTNMHPDINFLYLFNINYFIRFMEKNSYELVEKNINKVTKFLNFKNFDRKKYKDINMYDLLFKQKNEVK